MPPNEKRIALTGALAPTAWECIVTVWRERSGEVIHRLGRESSKPTRWQPMNNFGSPIWGR